MFADYDDNKWYRVDSDDPKLQAKGSIYFVTYEGKKYAGTYLGYSGGFVSIHDDFFQVEEVEKWIIRRDYTTKKSIPKKETIQYKGYKFFLALKRDIGQYWQASIDEVDEDINVKEPKRESAIRLIKKKIDQLTPNE